MPKNKNGWLVWRIRRLLWQMTEATFPEDQKLLNRLNQMGTLANALLMGIEIKLSAP